MDKNLAYDEVLNRLIQLKLEPYWESEGNRPLFRKSHTAVGLTA
jgi:hypothetical protein